MKAFAMTVDQHPEVMSHLEGRTVIFAPSRSGVSIDGDVVLFMSEPRSYWLEAIKVSEIKIYFL